MTQDNKKLEINNTPENFSKLLLLVNEQNALIKEYAVFCKLLKLIPKVDGTVTLNENVFVTLDSFLEDEESMDAYIEKLFKNHTIQ